MTSEIDVTRFVAKATTAFGELAKIFDLLPSATLEQILEAARNGGAQITELKTKIGILDDSTKILEGIQSDIEEAKLELDDNIVKAVDELIDIALDARKAKKLLEKLKPPCLPLERPGLLDLAEAATARIRELLDLVQVAACRAELEKQKSEKRKSKKRKASKRRLKPINGELAKNVRSLMGV